MTPTSPLPKTALRELLLGYGLVPGDHVLDATADDEFTELLEFLGLVVEDSTECSGGGKLPDRLDFSITNRNHLAVKEYRRVAVVWHHRDPLSWC